MKNRNYIEKLDILEKENIILNSLIISSNLYQNEESNTLDACIKLKSRTKDFQGVIQLIFTTIKQYYWYCENDCAIGYVERYKLINLENSIYLSLDPFDEQSKLPSAKDNYVIWAETVERKLII